MSAKIFSSWIFQTEITIISPKPKSLLLAAKSEESEKLARSVAPELLFKSLYV